jgi:hypothetical protein
MNVATAGNTRYLLKPAESEVVFNGSGGTSLSQISRMSSRFDIGIPYVYTLSRRGLTTTQKTNGNTNGTTTFSTNLNFSFTGYSIRLGGYSNPDTTLAQLYGGDIYEIVMFRNALTDQAIYQIEGYLAWKWGLQTSLPTTHPYYRVRP